MIALPRLLSEHQSELQRIVPADHTVPYPRRTWQRHLADEPQLAWLARRYPDCISRGAIAGCRRRLLAPTWYLSIALEETNGSGNAFVWGEWKCLRDVRMWYNPMVEGLADARTSSEAR